MFRNKWFHKSAPDPRKSLSGEIERTRNFAKTLRPSDDQRLWTARYNNAPKYCSKRSFPPQGPKYLSLPDLTAQTHHDHRDNCSDAGISYFRHKLSPTPQETERESKHLVISKPLNLHIREGRQRNAVSQPSKQQTKHRQPRSKKTSYKSKERRLDSKSETRQQRICLVFGED